MKKIIIVLIILLLSACQLSSNKKETDVNQYYIFDETTSNKILLELKELKFFENLDPHISNWVHGMHISQPRENGYQYSISYSENENGFLYNIYETYEQSLDFKLDGKEKSGGITINQYIYSNTEDPSMYIAFRVYGDEVSYYDIEYDEEQDFFKERKYSTSIQLPQEEMIIPDEIQIILKQQYEHFQSVCFDTKTIDSTINIITRTLNKDGKLTSADTSNYQMIETLEYDMIYPFFNNDNYSQDYRELIPDYYVVEKNNKYGLVNNNGILILDYYADSPYWCFEDNEIFQYTGQYDDIPFTTYQFGSGHGYVTGKYMYNKSESKALVCSRSDDGPNSYYYADSIPFKLVPYTSMDSCKLTVHGCDPVNESEKKGIMNSQGIPVTDAVYDNVLAFDSILLPVLKDEYYGYVNERGEEVIPCEYQAIREDRGDMIPYPVMNDSYVILKDQNDQFGIKDIQGNTVLEFEYECISPFYDNTFRVLKDNEWNTITLS